MSQFPTAVAPRPAISTEDRIGSVLAWTVLGLSGTILWLIVIRSLFPTLDMLSPLGPHAFAAGAVAAVALMLTRWRFFFLANALGLILLAPSLMSLGAIEKPGDTRMPWHEATLGERDVVRQLRVLSINTWHSNGDLDQLRHYILAADADVVVLSEFGPNKAGLLQQLKSAYPYQESCAAAWACSQALLSRAPFARSGTRMPTLKNPPMVWAEFRVGGVTPAKLTVIGTHVYRPTRHHGWHVAQLAGLAAHVRRTEGSVVLAGDFNMTRMSQSFDDFLHAASLVAPDRLLASWPAWPVPLPQFQLDYLFVSKDLEVVDQRLGHRVGSDHLPLWSAVKLPTHATLMASPAHGAKSSPAVE